MATQADQPTDTMTTERVIDVTTTGMDAAAVLRHLFDAVARKDLDALSEAWDEESTNEFLALGLEVVGRDALRAFFAEFFACTQDLVFTTEAVHAPSADTAIGQWHLTCTFEGGPFQGIEATGRPLDLRGCDVVQVVDGKVRRNTVYYDAATFAKQAGLLPPDGSRRQAMMTRAFNAATRLKARLRRG